MNLDIIKIEVKKYYDKRNTELANHNLVILEGVECLITKAECDFIEDYNRELRNDDLAFMKYLNNWN
jgi:hypothetical protein